VREGEPLARHTTFGIGGPGDLYLRVDSAEALVAAFVTAHQFGLPVFVLGSGSNILVGDGGIRGLVIENNAKGVDGPTLLESGKARVVAESGASFASLSRRLCRAGYWGLEWAVGIPGTLGGAVVYNAGAYGGSLADVLVSVRVADPTGTQRDIPAADLKLEYRGSVFTRGLLRDLVVVSTTFDVLPGDPEEVLRRMAELDGKRLAAQPRGRNAGSIFKNPPDQAAWWLIDQVGLRGHRAGDAEISAKHTNFFSNTGRATAADVKRLIDLAQAKVKEQFGIDLHREVQLVGEF
jgi:UDP-N-acetylmuramate dehydrogenase